MKSNYKQLGELVDNFDRRNKSLETSEVLGISIDKEFMPSVANTIGTDLSNYKLIHKNDFACNPMHAGRDERLPVSLYRKDNSAIVSPAYFMFRVKDEKEVLPEYLMLVFKRSDFDRNCWFRTDGSVRGGISWNDLCEIELPVPSITEQQKFVDAYNAIENRIQIKKKINEKLEETTSLIFKKHFTDELQYSMKSLDSLVTRIDNRGKTPPNTLEETPYPIIEIGSMKTKGRIISFENVEKYITKEYYETGFRAGNPISKDILMSTVGSLADLKIFWGSKGSIAQNIIGFRSKDPLLAMYIYQYMIVNKHELLAYEIGSVQASIKVTHVIEYKLKIPEDKSLLQSFDDEVCKITETIYKNTMEISELRKLKQLLITQLSK